MRKLMFGLGVAAVAIGAGLAGLAVSLLSQGPDRATQLLLAGGLFTIAFAAIVRE